MKKNLIFKILYLFLVLIVVAGASVFATNTYLASQVSYAKSDGTEISVENALNELYLAKQNSSNENIYFEKNFTNVSVTANQNNILSDITLPAGTYIIIGYASYEGNDLRYHLSLGSTNSSAYDNYGFVRMNITTIQNISDEQNLKFYLFPSKSVLIKSGFIRAIKIN